MRRFLTTATSLGPGLLLLGCEEGSRAPEETTTDPPGADTLATANCALGEGGSVLYMTADHYLLRSRLGS